MPAFLVRKETTTVVYAVVEAPTEAEAFQGLEEERGIRDLALRHLDPVVTTLDCRDAAEPLIERIRTAVATNGLSDLGDDVILNVSDWNYCDKWYRLSPDNLRTFRSKLLEDGLDAAWTWLCENTNYGTPESVGKPILRCDGAVDHTLAEFFFDYNNPEESASEWEELDEDEVDA